MTAEDLLARAKSRAAPPTGPGRTRASYKIYIPAIDYLATQGWRAVRIKEALAEDAKLKPEDADRLYDFIARRLRQ